VGGGQARIGVAAAGFGAAKQPQLQATSTWNQPVVTRLNLLLSSQQVLMPRELSVLPVAHNQFYLI
jgi:hypothetical protein